MLRFMGVQDAIDVVAISAHYSKHAVGCYCGD